MSQPPRIAIVQDFLLSFGGAERVIKLLHTIYPEAPIYTLLASKELLEREFPSADVRTSSLQGSWLPRQFLLGRYPQAIESFDLRGYDIVLSTSGAFAHGVITGPETVHICYCHSPLRYVWDWHIEYLRENGLDRGLLHLPVEYILSRLRIWDVVSARRVDKWIANSQTVQKRIAKFYRAEADVMYPPVRTEYFDPAQVTAQENRGSYAVSVSRLTPNKRVDLIIQACRAAKMPLIIAGTGSDEGRLRRMAQGDPSISFVGEISEEEKRQLVGNARCFVFAAEDDFGIAPVEALALGIPVVALARGGATETVRDGQNGVMFAEPTVESLTTALQRLPELSATAEQIRESSLRFSEERFIEEVKGHIDAATA